MRLEATFPILLCAGALVALSTAHADDSCKLAIEAQKKVFLTPVHVYTTTTSARSKNGPEAGEVIYVGGATYVKVRAQWKRVPITPAEMLKNREDEPNSKCQYLRDELVNGEPAAVYKVHSETDAGKTDGMLWIAKSKTLPLRAELDTDSGDALDKQHSSTRYEYVNVHPPDGVK